MLVSLLCQCTKTVMVKGVPETPLWARMHRIMDYRSPSFEHPSRATFKRAANVDWLPGSNSRLKQTRTCHSPLLGPLIREASAPLVEFDRTTSVAHQELIAQGGETGESALPSPTPGVRETSAPSSVELDKARIVAQRKADSTTVRVKEIANWLFNAWTVLPSAHYDLLDELLALGNPSYELFSKARVDCTTQLAFAAARRAPNSEVAAPSITTKPDAEEQVREVVQWINNVKPNADVLVLYELVALAAAAMEVVDSTPDSTAEQMENFLMYKARCIARACLLGYGASVTAGQIIPSA